MKHLNYHDDFSPLYYALTSKPTKIVGACEEALTWIATEQDSTLVVLHAIGIHAARPGHRATRLVMQCKGCQSIKRRDVRETASAIVLPRFCDAKNIMSDEGQRCPMDPYVLLPDQCLFFDHQSLKLQELPEEVPTGEMPRHIPAVATRYLVDQLTPGTRVRVTAIYTSTDQSKSSRGITSVSVKNAHLFVVGFEVDSASPGRNLYSKSLSPDDEEKFLELSRLPDVREKIFSSIAPAIYGQPDIKRAVACLLFGGSRKILPDKTKLRGDINVLLLGDPSTAKSQFLKYAERAAPVAVYTSGKGSSAAGLTAAIIRDAQGHFVLEGGAMVLADGGIVCIDEFDKMRNDDRVAIHEAMEQQTISIAKAGITTVLNTRCAVLSAANPMFGSYDDTKEAAEQLEFQSTILSRFDLIFLVRDIRDAAKDETLARHVFALHQGGDVVNHENDVAIPVDFLKKYIFYAKTHCSPRMNAEAAQRLESLYVDVRNEVRLQKERERSNKVIPITVRQLEAIARISESLCRMELANEVRADHVDEAIRLFNVATREAAKCSMRTESMDKETAKAVREAEDLIKRRLHIHGRVARMKLVADIGKRGIDPPHVLHAIRIMCQRGDLMEKDDWSIYRVR
eukprot:GHVL01020264.1.p1 GENE.GHVL01020264.1~~GHVL01020264.1.p1  ORF type:complete len:703 (-),score=117.53 GHVL01020264.1:625-2502(-)